jgi:hypothetical protein
MQRAKVVKVIIFSYGFCLERGLLLRIQRTYANATRWYDHRLNKS